MNSQDIAKYKSLYLKTSWEYLNSLMKNVDFLLKGSKTDEIMDSLFLAAHSLKSQSILMGYDQIGRTSELLEKIYRSAKEKTLEFSDEMLQVILSGLKKIEVSLTQIGQNGDEVEMHEDISKLEKFLIK